MKTRCFLALASLAASASVHGALYNLSDQDLLLGGTTPIDQPTLSAQNIPAVIIDGALFARGAANSGSGTFRDIVRFDGDRNLPGGFDDGQQAYNRATDNTAFQDSFIGQEDGVIQVQDMVSDSTGYFYVFRLDINNEGFTSIDQLQIWTSSTNYGATGEPAAPNNYSELTTALGVTPNIYDLDGTEDHTIFLNSDDSPGSGASDLAFFIPQSNFAGTSPTDYVYFFAQMNGFDEAPVGGLTEADGTTAVDISAKQGNHESFAIPTAENEPIVPVAIPEPGSVTLLLLAMAIGMKRRRS